VRAQPRTANKKNLTKNKKLKIEKEKKKNKNKKTLVAQQYYTCFVLLDRKETDRSPNGSGT